MDQPNTTRIEAYSKSKMVALGQEISSRKKIYLDVLFWIFARDAMLGIRNDTDSRKLLHFLRRGVSNGTLICPISTSTFSELMKQPFTPERRIATAKLIDELSLGVTMVTSQSIVGTEIHRWLLLRKGVQDVHSMQELIWTKVISVYGDMYPHWPNQGLSDDQEFELQRSYFDFVWDRPLLEMIEKLGDIKRPPNAFVAASDEYNRQNKIWAHELTSFKVAYDIELRGGIEASAANAAQIVLEVADTCDGGPMSSSSIDQAAREKGAKNLLYDGFTKGDAKDHIRSLHIFASIHTAWRRDTQRQIKPNDIYDCQHATAALAYCDAFFTENDLRAVVSRNDLGLEEVNGCQVISDIGLAVEFLKQIS
jgi:hypothetical protein